MEQQLIQKGKFDPYEFFKLHGKVNFQVTNGYSTLNDAWRAIGDISPPPNGNAGVPSFPFHFFGHADSRDLIVDFYGDAKKLKLQLGGIIQSINIQHVGYEPKVEVNNGIFSKLNAQTIEVSGNSRFTIDSNSVFVIDEKVKNITIRLHNSVDTVLLLLPANIRNVILRIFGSIAEVLVKHFITIHSPNIIFRQIELVDVTYTSKLKFRRKNLWSTVQTVIRWADTIITFIRYAGQVPS